MIWTATFGFVVAASIVSAGCAFAQDADDFIRAVDKAPPEKRPPNWEQTKALMARRPPAVGELAPDFTLKSVDGEKTVTRSKLDPGKPQMLLFGSYT